MRDFPDVIDTWLEDLVRQGKSQHTVEAYRRGVQHFIQWNSQLFDETFDLAAIIPRDVRDWKSYQQSVEKAAPSTINQRLSALSSFFSWAIMRDIVPKNPTVNISTIQLTKRHPRSLSESALRRLLRKVHKGQVLRDIAIVEMLVGTGIRVGELLGLHVGDVVLQERSGLLIVREGKQGNYREIPLTKEVRRALASYLETHPNQEDPNAPLWVSSYGSLSQRSSIRYLLNQYAQQAGIKQNLNPHMLRHTFATRYLAANPDDLRGLAALLGHASLDTVMIYTEPTIEDLAARMERVELHSQSKG